MTDRHTALVSILARIDQTVERAEALTIARGDDDTLQLASAVLADMRAARLEVESKLQNNS